MYVLVGFGRQPFEVSNFWDWGRVAGAGPEYFWSTCSTLFERRVEYVSRTFGCVFSTCRVLVWSVGIFFRLHYFMDMFGTFRNCQA